MNDILTIFTPTFNRAYLLKNLYFSLCNQTNYNFEWLIVDDESDDNTENLINELTYSENRFKIRYYKQIHGGKHRAINKAVQVAKGEYFFIVDSDDELTSDAVELVMEWTKSIKGVMNLCGVSGLRISRKGKVWGENLKSIKTDYVDATGFEREKYGLLGDKAEVYSINILKKYPFPEFDGEYFVTEAVCWDAIASAGYKLRWYNKPIYICDYLDDGLTKNGANDIKGHLNNYQGYLYYIRQSLELKTAYQFAPNFLEYERTANYLNLSYSDRSKELGISSVEYCVYKVFLKPLFLLIRKLKRRIK